VGDLPNRHVRQAQVTREPALRQEPKGHSPGEHESSPRLAARDGMEQETLRVLDSPSEAGTKG